MRWVQSIAAGIATLAAAGCSSVGPDYRAPEISVATEWRETDVAGAASSEVEQPEWWRAFDDPVLDGLVERALAQGLEVREALARVREARALRGGEAARQLPTFDALAAVERRGESERTPFGAAGANADLYSAGFDASWEIDLWGGVRRAVEAADAELAASVEDARGVVLAVVAETALNYVELRAFQRRSEIARRNVELQEQTLALVQARFDAGLVGERDVAQAATNVAITRSRVPALESGGRAAENRLTVLLGLAPGALAAELASGWRIPARPVDAAVGVPADLIRRRPDISRAERLLAAEHARIGVAVAELYPRLALAGNLGVAAGDASDLARSGSGFFGIGPSVRWNLFDGARLRRIDAQHARVEQALVRWERAVLTGLEEAENAMTALAREQERRRSLVQATSQGRRAVELAQVEYAEGLSDFQAVLDSQRALALIEDELAQSEAAAAAHAIAVHKAIGGGLTANAAVAAL